MKIAVTYENEQIFQHFGHTEQFKVYEVEDGKIVSERVMDTNGQGHGALASLLSTIGADVLICGGIGGGAQMALAAAGIRLFGGVSGNADAAAGIDNSNDNLVNGDEGSAAIAARCLVNVTIGNIKKIQMPLSGESGLALIIALGLGVTAISAAGIIFRGKKKESKK